VDLIARVRRVSFARPHLLVVAAPGAVETRLAVERYARQRGWPAAESAADADVLAVVGSPDSGLAAVVAVLESQISAPWSRVDLVDAGGVAAGLDSVPAWLANWSPEPGAAHRHSHPAPERDPDSGQTHLIHEQHAGHEPHVSGDQHSGHDEHAGHGPPGQSGHEGDEGHESHEGDEGHGGHEHHMGPVAGLPMASRAPDRDGLRLDVLHVPLGPVLPYWPAGLRLSLAVQGDVVQEATVETVGVDGAGFPFWDEPVLRALAGAPTTAGEVARRRAASHLDSLVRLLGVAGWDGPALRCAVLRDRTLAGESARDLAEAFRPLGRRLVKSRVLRRMTEGLGELDGRTCDRIGVSGPAAIAAGDVWARLRQWVRSTGDDLRRLDDRSLGTNVEGPRGRLDRPEPPSAVLLAVLPALLVGAELAGVRLIVASLDPDVAELLLRPAVSARG